MAITILPQRKSRSFKSELGQVLGEGLGQSLEYLANKKASDVVRSNQANALMNIIPNISKKEAESLTYLPENTLSKIISNIPELSRQQLEGKRIEAYTSAIGGSPSVIRDALSPADIAGETERAALEPVPTGEQLAYESRAIPIPTRAPNVGMSSTQPEATSSVYAEPAKALPAQNEDLSKIYSNEVQAAKENISILEDRKNMLDNQLALGLITPEKHFSEIRSIDKSISEQRDKINKASKDYVQDVRKANIEQQKMDIDISKHISPYIDSIEKKRKGIEGEILRIGAMRELASKNDTGSPLWNWMLSVPGLRNLKFAKTAKAQLFDKLRSDFITELPNIMTGAGRITNEIIKYYMDSIPSLTNSENGLRLILQARDLINRHNKVEVDLFDKIVKERGGNVPYNIKELVQSRIADYSAPIKKELMDKLSLAIDLSSLPEDKKREAISKIDAAEEKILPSGGVESGQGGISAGVEKNVPGGGIRSAGGVSPFTDLGSVVSGLGEFGKGVAGTALSAAEGVLGAPQDIYQGIYGLGKYALEKSGLSKLGKYVPEKLLPPEKLKLPTFISKEGASLPSSEELKGYREKYIGLKPKEGVSSVVQDFTRELAPIVAQSAIGGGLSVGKAIGHAVKLGISNAIEKGVEMISGGASKLSAAAKPISYFVMELLGNKGAVKLKNELEDKVFGQAKKLKPVDISTLKASKGLKSKIDNISRKYAGKADFIGKKTASGIIGDLKNELYPEGTVSMKYIEKINKMPEKINKLKNDAKLMRYKAGTKLAESKKLLTESNVFKRNASSAKRAGRIEEAKNLLSKSKLNKVKADELKNISSSLLNKAENIGKKTKQLAIERKEGMMRISHPKKVKSIDDLIVLKNRLYKSLYGSHAPKSVIKEISPLVKSVDSIIEEAISKRNPSFVKNYKIFNEVSSAIHKSNAPTKPFKFISKTVNNPITKRILSGGGLISAFGEKQYSGPALKKIIVRMVKSPTIRNLYMKSMENAMKGSIVPASLYARKLDKEIDRYSDIIKRIVAKHKKST